MKKNLLFTGLFLLIGMLSGFSQNDYRVSDPNHIGWFAYVGTFKLTDKWDLHTEYQWRRDNFVTNWQQSQIRAGLTYNLNKQVAFHGGYSFINTYPYGDYPIASKGYPYPEHRVYEQVVLKNPIGKLDIQHRFRLEQRWVGKMKTAATVADRGVEEWIYTNRFRYMCRLNYPLKGNAIENKTPYIGAFQEIFVSFGKNVKSNLFDQSRSSVLFGYKFNPLLKLELGPFAQIQQQGGWITKNSKQEAVIQYNTGFLFNVLINVDLRKKETTK